MGECPVWDERENSLVYVDINSQKVCRGNPVTDTVQCVPVGKTNAFSKTIAYLHPTFQTNNAQDSFQLHTHTLESS